jgi:hypothetical protein
VTYESCFAPISCNGFDRADVGRTASLFSCGRPYGLGEAFSNHLRNRPKLREYHGCCSGQSHGPCKRDDQRPGTQSETVFNHRLEMLPQAEDGESEYRIRSVEEQHELVAKESELITRGSPP